MQPLPLYPHRSRTPPSPLSPQTDALLDWLKEVSNKKPEGVRVPGSAPAEEKK